MGLVQKIKQKNGRSGFTLVEIMVSITIFGLVFGIISSMFASAIKAQRKSLVSQDLLSQVSYSMEYIGRHLRMAKEQTGGLPAVCLSQDGLSYETTTSGIKFVSYDDPSCCWEFYLEGSRLKRKISSCSSKNSDDYLTSANFEVERFNINLVEGTGEQPRITFSLKIKGKGERPEEQPIIEAQTTISQRNLNVE